MMADGYAVVSSRAGKPDMVLLVDTKQRCEEFVAEQEKRAKRSGSKTTYKIERRDMPNPGNAAYTISVRMPPKRSQSGQLAEVTVVNHLKQDTQQIKRYLLGAISLPTAIHDALWRAGIVDNQPVIKRATRDAAGSDHRTG